QSNATCVRNPPLCNRLMKIDSDPNFPGNSRVEETVADWFLEGVADARIAIRSYRRQPRFTIVALLTLALGIGGTTAMFSVVNAVLLRPPPLPAPGRLVLVRETYASDVRTNP